jgi:1-acyl-sn-glycerol-3-phosphate acyltransferase
VDRTRPDRAGILSQWRALVSDRLSLIVFPEGTRSQDGRVGRFRAGSFMLALEAGLTVVPLAVSGSRHVMKKGRLMACPGDITLVVHEPIPAPQVNTPTVADARALGELVRAVVRASVDRLEAGQ